jgi:hypothetical protein
MDLLVAELEDVASISINTGPNVSQPVINQHQLLVQTLPLVHFLLAQLEIDFLSVNSNMVFYMIQNSMMTIIENMIIWLFGWAPSKMETQTSTNGIKVYLIID